MFKKTWKKPNLTNLSLKNTKTGVENRSITNGTCSACHATNITVEYLGDHLEVINLDGYTGYLCLKDKPGIS
ncbi:MAG: hypothetical protein RR904_07015 [Bacilli bacterium]